MTGDEHAPEAEPPVCARCVRLAHDDADFARWVADDAGGEICPGCLTLTEEVERRESGR